ncbi:MAG: hypothetical protein WC648_05375 [Candidatus Paceibacterota bacterium]|jgi:hypothetical protein
MATDDGMIESDEYEDWVKQYGEEEPRKNRNARPSTNTAHGKIVLLESAINWIQSNQPGSKDTAIETINAVIAQLRHA